MAEAAAHPGHDPLVVAASVDRGTQLAPVLALCLRCAALYADLVALAVALPLAVGPARPRDFTLTVDDARRLRRQDRHRWWAAVGSARDHLTRPLAAGFTTLGLAGLLLTAGPAFLPVSGSGAGAAEDAPFKIAAQPFGSPAPTDASLPEAEHLPPVAPWLGFLAVGGGLFVARRAAAHGRRVR